MNAADILRAHAEDQLLGRLVRRLNEATELLEVSLSALHNKTPRTEVAVERIEVVLDTLRAEIKNLSAAQAQH